MLELVLHLVSIEICVGYHHRVKSLILSILQCPHFTHSEFFFCDSGAKGLICFTNKGICIILFLVTCPNFLIDTVMFPCIHSIRFWTHLQTTVLSGSAPISSAMVALNSLTSLLKVSSLPWSSHKTDLVVSIFTCL